MAFDVEDTMTGDRGTGAGDAGDFLKSLMARVAGSLIRTALVRGAGILKLED